jgi:hypothetical protein
MNGWSTHEVRRSFIGCKWSSSVKSNEDLSGLVIAPKKMLRLGNHQPAVGADHLSGEEVGGRGS